MHAQISSVPKSLAMLKSADRNQITVKQKEAAIVAATWEYLEKFCNKIALIISDESLSSEKYSTKLDSLTTELKDSVFKIVGGEENTNADTRGYYPLTELIKSHDQALYDMVCRDALEPGEATVSECFKRIASQQPIEDIRQSASYEIKSLERKGNLKKSDFNSLTRKFSFYYRLIHGDNNLSKLATWKSLFKTPSVNRFQTKHERILDEYAEKTDEKKVDYNAPGSKINLVALNAACGKEWDNYVTKVTFQVAEQDLFTVEAPRVQQSKNTTVSNPKKRERETTNNGSQHHKKQKFVKVENPCPLCSGEKYQANHERKNCKRYDDNDAEIENWREKAGIPARTFNKKSNTLNNKYLTALSATKTIKKKQSKSPPKNIIEFYIDSGANINIVRSRKLLKHITQCEKRIKVIGNKIHIAKECGIAELYTKDVNNKTILIRFNAVYIPPSPNEEVNIIGINKIVKNMGGCHCVGNCLPFCSGDLVYLALPTVEGNMIHLKTTHRNNLTTLETRIVKKDEDEDIVIDATSRRLVNDKAKTFAAITEDEQQNLNQNNSDDEEQALDNEKESFEVYNVTVIEKIVEKNNSNFSPNKEKEDQKLEELAQNFEKLQTLEIRQLKAREKAMLIHQKCTHWSSKNIIQGFKNGSLGISDKVLDKLLIHELENLKCPECSQTRKYTIQHPTTKTKQRSEYFGQRIGVDVLMNPNRIRTDKKDLTNQTFEVSKTDSKSSLPTTIILEEYEALNAFQAPYAIVFVDECSRYITVIPLQKLTEDDFVEAFRIFQEELMRMMAKVQRNADRKVDGTALKINLQKVNIDFFAGDMRIQEILTDQQSGMFTSAKFRKFLKEMWFRQKEEPTINHEKNSITFTDAVLQVVPRDTHAFNGMAERAIRTLKEKAMANIMTAFGHLSNTDLDHKIYTYWFWALKNASVHSNIMPKTVHGKSEISPYTYITGKTFPITEIYPFMSNAKANMTNEEAMNYGTRMSDRKKTPTEKGKLAFVQSDWKKNKNHKVLPQIEKHPSIYFYTDITGPIPTPVLFDEKSYTENHVKLSSRQNQNQLKNLVFREKNAFIDERTFIKSIYKPLDSTNGLVESIALLSLAEEDDENYNRNSEMEEFAAFLGSSLSFGFNDDAGPKQDEDIMQHRRESAKSAETSSRVCLNAQSTPCTSSCQYYCLSAEEDETIFRHYADIHKATTPKSDNFEYRAFNCQEDIDDEKFNRYEQDFLEKDQLYALAVSRLNSEDEGPKTQKTLDQFSKQEIQDSINKEMQGIRDKGVLQDVSQDEWRKLTKENPRLKLLTTRWVITVKENGDLKSRFVAKGYTQRPGENYYQTYSPVVDRVSVNVLLNIAAIKGLKLFSLDISQAFLQAPIDEDVYIKHEGKIYKLLRSLYGTKQAARMWNKEITKVLKEYNCKQSKTDPCMFVKFDDENKPILFISVSTDDLLVASTKEDWRNLAQFLSTDFQGRFITSQLDIENECTSFNGIEIKRESNHKISINLNVYTEKLIEEFRKKLHQIKPRASLPIYKSGSEYQGREAEPCDQKEITEYQSIIGQMTWLACNTRPDLSHFTASASRASKNPNKGQLKLVRLSVGYLIANPKMSITFDGTGIDEIRLEAFTDAGESKTIFSQNLPRTDATNSRHTSGYVLSMGSGAIAWKSKQQTRTVGSICHGEYTAAHLCLEEIKFVAELLGDVGFPQTRTIMFIDNQATIELMLANTSLKKHDKVTLHILQEAVEDRIVIPVYIPGDVNIADLFTKAKPHKEEKYGSG